MSTTYSTEYTVDVSGSHDGTCTAGRVRVLLVDELALLHDPAPLAPPARRRPRAAHRLRRRHRRPPAAAGAAPAAVRGASAGPFRDDWSDNATPRRVPGVLVARERRRCRRHPRPLRVDEAAAQVARVGAWPRVACAA
uniref:Uncharacterized protein n=1 Tax=Oryza brachyantha TaxID=4533 RepID=J3MP73_ORYBR